MLHNNSTSLHMGTGSITIKTSQLTTLVFAVTPYCETNVKHLQCIYSSAP